MRVGAWRFFELYARLGIRPTLAINARVCEDYPRVAEEAKRDGWEFMGHSYEQGPIHKEPDQAAMIERSLSVIERFTGTRPVGWLGPGLTQTLETPDLLAAAGIKYIGDWVYDDEPTTIRTANGPLVTLPYTVELNDIPMMIVQHHESELSAPARHRPVRPALRRGQGAREDHGARDPSLHQRPAAPDQIPRSDLRLREPLRRRAALERRSRSSTGTSGAPRTSMAGTRRGAERVRPPHPSTQALFLQENFRTHPPQCHKALRFAATSRAETHRVRDLSGSPGSGLITYGQRSCGRGAGAWRYARPRLVQSGCVSAFAYVWDSCGRASQARGLAGLRRIFAAPVGLCLVAMLSGCITADRPDLGIEIPGRIALRPLRPRAPPTLDWWRGFRSKELTDLIEEAHAAQFRHRGRGRPHHPGRRREQDRRRAAAARASICDANATRTRSSQANGGGGGGRSERVSYHGRAQRQLRARLLGQEPRDLARRAGDRDRGALRPRRGRDQHGGQRRHRLFPGAVVAGAAAHRAPERQPPPSACSP